MDYKLIVIAVIVLAIIIFVYWYFSKSSFTYTTGYAYPSGVATTVQMSFYDTQVQLVSIQDWCMAMSRVYNAVINMMTVGNLVPDFAGLSPVVSGGKANVYPFNGTVADNVVYGTLISSNASSNQVDNVLISNLIKQFPVTSGQVVAGYSTLAGNTVCDIVSENFFGYPGSANDAFSTILSTPATSNDTTLTAAIGNSTFLSSAVGFPTILSNILITPFSQSSPTPFNTLFNLCNSINNVMKTTPTLSALTAGMCPAGTIDVTYLLGAYAVSQNAATKTANMVQFNYYMKDLISASALLVNYDPIVFTSGISNATSYKNFNLFAKLSPLIPSNAAIASLASYPNYNGVVGSVPGKSPILTAALNLKNSLVTLINYVSVQQYLCDYYVNNMESTKLTAADISAVGNSIVTDGSKFYSTAGPSSSSVPVTGTITQMIASFMDFRNIPGTYNTVYNGNDDINAFNSCKYFNANRTNLYFGLISKVSQAALTNIMSALNSLTVNSTDQQALSVVSACGPIISVMPSLLQTFQQIMLNPNYAQYRLVYTSIANDIISAIPGFTWNSSVGTVSTKTTPFTSTPALTSVSINNGAGGYSAPPVPCADVSGMLASITKLLPPTPASAAVGSGPLPAPGYNPITVFLSNFIIASNKTSLPVLSSSGVTPADVNNMFALGAFILWAETIIFGPYQSTPVATDFTTVPYSNTGGYAILDTITAFDQAVNQ